MKGQRADWRRQHRSFSFWQKIMYSTVAAPTLMAFVKTREQNTNIWGDVPEIDNRN
jgi:hypothetical protein